MIFSNRSLKANMTDTAKNIAGPKDSLSNYFFKLYPNLINKSGAFFVQTSENGEIAFYNALGELLLQSELRRGLNNFNCSQINCETSVILYKAFLDNGRIESGKIVTIK